MREAIHCPLFTIKFGGLGANAADVTFVLSSKPILRFLSLKQHASEISRSKAMVARVLCVAEKPSIAKAVAQHLAGGQITTVGGYGLTTLCSF